MNSKIILIVPGEPNSTFSEILFKYIKSAVFKKNKSRIVIIGCKKLLESQMKLLKYKIHFNEICSINESKINLVNLINVNFKFKKAFTKITDMSNRYIEECFSRSLKIIKDQKLNILINGPISKKHFLKKKFPGITEYISEKTNSSNPVMLIYNDKIAVTPLTTHIPIKNVAKFVKKKNIINNITKINKFFKKNFEKKPKFAVLGLNPHCETINKISEEKIEIMPAIEYLNKKKIDVAGPFSADTFFLKKNIKKYDVVLGMYHDQVLTPIKTLFEYNAINITMGLPFLRVSPDHGPNEKMIGKNLSNPLSLIKAIKFLDRN